MDIRKIRENLGRIKIYYLKSDTQRALGAAVMALKELGATPPPTDVRSLLREGVQLLARDEAVKSRLTAPLFYQPGQERALLRQLAKLYQQVEEAANSEAMEVTRQRKQELDQALLLGQKLLVQGNASEADASFQTAVGLYRDEHKMFQMIGKMLIDAEQARRAFPYLKKAVELEPDNQTARELFEIASRAREADPRA